MIEYLLAFGQGMWALRWFWLIAGLIFCGIYVFADDGRRP